jgi:hypothetical protein
MGPSLYPVIEFSRYAESRGTTGPSSGSEIQPNASRGPERELLELRNRTPSAAQRPFDKRPRRNLYDCLPELRDEEQHQG